MTGRRAASGVINEAAAKFYFRNRDAIGATIELGSDAQRRVYEIAGIVRDAKHMSVRQQVPRILYIPTGQRRERLTRLTLAVRTAGDPVRTIPVVQREVRAMGPDVLVTEVMTLQQQVNAALIQERLLSTVGGFFSFLALVLSAVGLYGLLSYVVRQRTGEIGVRMALGADRGDVVWMVLRRSLWLVAIGVAIGVPAALWASRPLSALLLWGLEPGDPVTVAIGVFGLAATSMVASYLPGAAGFAHRSDRGPAERVRFLRRVATVGPIPARTYASRPGWRPKFEVRAETDTSAKKLPAIRSFRGRAVARPTGRRPVVPVSGVSCLCKAGLPTPTKTMSGAGLRRALSRTLVVRGRRPPRRPLPENAGHGDEGRYIDGFYAEQQTGQKPCERVGKDSSERDAAEGQLHTLRQDQPEHVSADGAQGHADADFLGALFDGVGHQSVDADRGQDQGDGRKNGEQHHVEVLPGHASPITCSMVRIWVIGISLSWEWISRSAAERMTLGSPRCEWPTTTEARRRRGRSGLAQPQLVGRTSRRPRHA